MRYVIIGNSAAGLSAAAAVAETDPDGTITILSAEREKAYTRTMLAHYLAGEVGLEKMYCREADNLAELGVKVRTGIRVERIAAGEKKLLLSDGSELAYDRLLLATGSLPIVPPVPGIEKKGIHTLWTLNDARAVAEAVSKARAAVVVGAGFIGIQAAVALRAADLRVTVVEKLDGVLPAQLDRGAASLVEKALGQAGISVETGVEVTEFTGAERVKGVVTTKGQMDCDLVVVAVGVRPDLRLVEDTGIAVRDGILVDRRMRTSVRDIYAAGDVVEAFDLALGKETLNAIWPSAVAQGRCAGQNMAGRGEEYRGDVGFNSMEVYGLQIATLGVSRPRAGSYEKIVLEEGEGFYRQVVLQDGILKGAIMVGDIQGAGILETLIRKEVDVSGCLELLGDKPLQFGKLLMFAPEIKATLLAAS